MQTKFQGSELDDPSAAPISRVRTAVGIVVGNKLGITRVSEIKTVKPR
jgi:hypothetical protein